MSGKNIIKMDTLRQLFKELGFQNVTTYVQSGNVVFSFRSVETGELEELISHEIEQDFGFKIPVIVMTIGELKDSIAQNPFSGTKEEKFLHYTFLAARPKKYNNEDITNKKGENEEVSVFERVVYLYCPNGYGKTKLTNTFFESKLKVTATTRNFRTTAELLKIAESQKELLQNGGSDK